ncbi:1089_t:CDS:2 [Dentiscutata heterogama]|uniref:1089_t:CDS:1 n=1 Tax=Dentiscutata heterogama TaxID=1316150 RepID=A0ACA9MNK8_9GLOM|nr:1089_t:CDS:2 [Dentiscutata heterogama]
MSYFDNFQINESINDSAIFDYSSDSTITSDIEDTITLSDIENIIDNVDNNNNFMNIDNSNYDDNMSDIENSDFNSLENCILTTSGPIISSPIRLGPSYSLLQYLETFLLPATEDNFSLSDIKNALSNISSDDTYDTEGNLIFPQINFSNYETNLSNNILYKFDLDSFLLNTYSLNIINTPIQFFPFANKMWNLKHHNHEYCDVIDQNNIKKKDKMINIPHMQFAQFGDCNKNSVKLDFGIEFISSNTTSFNSIYWKRNTVINLLYGIGVTFSTNITRSRIDNWAHTYDICGAVGEAKQRGIRHNIFYAQAYHIEKEVFTSSIPTLLSDLNERDAVFNSEKVQNACDNLIEIFKENFNMNYGARLEYRIGYSILDYFFTILLNRLPTFFNSNPFYIIPTEDILNFKIAKLKTLLNTYNLSLNFSSQQLTSNHKVFKICLVILMKSINQSFTAIPFIKKYFGDSNSDNENNVGTLELYQIIERSNVAWLLPDIFDIDNCIVNFSSQINQQQLLITIPDEYKNITSEEKNQIENWIDIIKATNRFDNELNLLINKIWLLFIEDCINLIPRKFIITPFTSFNELSRNILDIHLTDSNYSFTTLRRCVQNDTRVSRFKMHFDYLKEITKANQGWDKLKY